MFSLPRVRDLLEYHRPALLAVVACLAVGELVVEIAVLMRPAPACCTCPEVR